MHNSESVSCSLLITNWNEKWMTRPLLSHEDCDLLCTWGQSRWFVWVSRFQPSKRRGAAAFPHNDTTLCLNRYIEEGGTIRGVKNLTRTLMTQYSYDTSHSSNWDEFVTSNQDLIETLYSVLSILSPLWQVNKTHFEKRTHYLLLLLVL